MATRLKILAGAFVGCRNERLLKYPRGFFGFLKRLILKRNLKRLVETAGFGAIEVRIVDYGQGNGPMIFVGLKESSFVIGAWPEIGNTLDFFVHYCEREENNNDQKAKRLVDLVYKFSEAESFKFSPLTPGNPALLLELP